MVKHIAAGLGIGAGLIGMAIHARGGQTIQDKIGRVVESMIGINPLAGPGHWDWRKMVFTIPAAGGITVSAIAAKTGANRYTPKGLNI